MCPPYLIAHQSLSCFYLNWMIPNAFKTFWILSSQKPILAQKCSVVTHLFPTTV